MTYRNDHEAALARVDALEQELAQLRKTEPVRPKPSRGGMPGLAIAGGILALAAGVAGGVAIAIGSEPAAVKQPASEVRGEPGVGASGDRGTLTSCANAIQPKPALDAESTNPRGPHRLSVDAIGRTAAPCREQLHAFVGGSADERDALWQWAVSEDELAGTISRIEVYYANDPYKLDDYSTARQLWLEYDRACHVRNRVLEQWRLKFAAL